MAYTPDVPSAAGRKGGEGHYLGRILVSLSFKSAQHSETHLSSKQTTHTGYKIISLIHTRIHTCTHTILQDWERKLSHRAHEQNDIGDTSQ